MTTQGFCIFAQHNKNTDYAKQAYALAMSIKIQMPNSKVCLITHHIWLYIL